MKLSDRAVEALSGLGGAPVDPPVLIEAKVPLELSGESIRSRLCTFVDQNGREWALRPDLTLVVAQDEAARRETGEAGETVRTYHGSVFRLPSDPADPVEYEQVGLERFGAARGDAEDVRLFETLADAARACGATSGHVSVGDLAIFPAFVDAIGFAPDIAAGLKRAFRQAGGVRAYLKGAAPQAGGLSSRMSGLDRAEVAAFVDDIFAMTGVRPVGVRSGDEIVDRLYERSRSGIGDGLAAEQIELLEQVLELSTDLAGAPAALSAIADAGSLKGLDDCLETFARRAESLLAGAMEPFGGNAAFATGFGRRFTYYDGFVFEIAHDRFGGRPFMAGGRYDSLISDLSGGRVEATALGGVIIPHRLAAALGDRS